MSTANVTFVSHVSEEEENYLRMHLLVAGTSPKAVRILFDKEFHPSRLAASIKSEYGKLSDLKTRRVINAAQWKLLFPRGGKYYMLNPLDLIMLMFFLKRIVVFLIL